MTHQLIFQRYAKRRQHLHLLLMPVGTEGEQRKKTAQLNLLTPP